MAQHGSEYGVDLQPKEGLGAHLHVLGLEKVAMSALPYAAQDAVLLHGLLPGTGMLQSHRPSHAQAASPFPISLPRPLRPEAAT